MCGIAASIYSELGDAKLKGKLKSNSFLADLSRLSDTGHAARLFPKLEEYGLAAKVPITWVDVKGLSWKHPVLSFRDICKCLSDNDKMHLMVPNDVPLQSFWERYRAIEPTHPVFEVHANNLANVVPTLCHADEGTSQKKRGIMIMNIQPLIGSGTSRGGAGLNFIGQSLATRFLYTTMASKLYGGKKSGRLRSLVYHLAHELKHCFENPIDVLIRGERRQIYFACLAMKGDWPALTKMGRLCRHHLRDSNKSSPGICHLCKAGQDGFPWHLWDFKSMQAMHENPSEPFHIPGGGPLTSILPQPSGPGGKARFFKPDVFHNLHKGLVGDLVANPIASWLIYCPCLLYMPWESPSHTSPKSFTPTLRSGITFGIPRL